MTDHPIPLELRVSAQIQTFSDGSFQEDPDSEIEALLLPVRDAQDAIVDIVAWPIGSDRPWYRLKNTGDVLGASAIDACRWPRTGHASLILYESPARWLRSIGPNAVCILDWSVNLADLFAGIDQEIICESKEIRDHFEATLLDQRPVGLSASLRVLE